MSLHTLDTTSMAPTYAQRGPTPLTPLGGNPPGQVPLSASSANYTSGAASAPSSLVSRTQTWIEENQRLLILGACVAVVGGAGYLLYNRPSTGQARGRGADQGETSSSAGLSGTAAAGKKNKKKKSKKTSGLKEGFLKGEGDEGPLLEEIKPKEPQVSASEAKQEKAGAAKVEDETEAGVPAHLQGESGPSLAAQISFTGPTDLMGLRNRIDSD